MMRISHARIRTVVSALFLVAIWSTSGPGLAWATSITVSTTDDELNADGDCSLREAIQAANGDVAVDNCPAGAGADVITLAAGIHQLSLTGASEDGNATGDLDIDGDVKIVGAGAGAGMGATVIDGADIDRVIHILAGTVTIRSLTVRNGLAPASLQLGVPGQAGGGIYNNGNLTLEDCEVAENESGEGDHESWLGGSGSNGGAGAGVASTGVLTVRNCVIRDNTAGQGGLGEYPGAGGAGGGVYSAGSLTVEGSIFTGNWAGQSGLDGLMLEWYGGPGGAISSRGPLIIRTSELRDNNAGSGDYACDGGAIDHRDAAFSVRDTLIDRNTSFWGSFDGATVHLANASGEIVNTTISNNYPGPDGAISIANGQLDLGHSTVIDNERSNLATAAGGTIQVRSSIVITDQAAVECVGAVVSSGHNLFGAGGGCPMGTGDATIASGALRTSVVYDLDDNGGPTRTFALRAGSPAVDAGACTDPGGAAVTTDQRGFGRPGGPACDMGAYERNAIGAPLYPTLIEVSPEPVGGNCPFAGQRIEVGEDLNGNGILEPVEVNSTSFACNGADGVATLLELTDLAVGDGTCPIGGTRVDAGRDDNGNGILDGPEIDSVSYLCRDAQVLLRVTGLAIGDSDCPGGGTRIESGTDDDGNGVLDPDEVAATTVVCSGSTTLVQLTAVPAGDVECPAGGTRVESGRDSDGDGILDPDEVLDSAVICRNPGSLIDIAELPVGDDNCAGGGQRIDVGIDVDGDGVLTSGEVDSTSYVCQPVSEGCHAANGQPTWPVMLILLALFAWRRGDGFGPG